MNKIKSFENILFPSLLEKKNLQQGGGKTESCAEYTTLYIFH